MGKSENGRENREMQSVETNAIDTQRDVRQWLNIHKKAALKIDPSTAVVWKRNVQNLDPYGIDPDLPEEFQLVGSQHFARNPDSDIWVWFGDLAEDLRLKLWENLEKSEPAFPDELPWLD